ncbi:MAG TPA: zinc finger Ran-binding domain-containing protein [Candidatus Limnocylindrales bacterium]|nr:zinc finger Ran-binding domain-containing protein [Candidatus Limnocylindrales bacterium]
MRSGGEVWICGRCRSVNPASRSRCYKCNTPVEVAATRPEDLAFVHEERAPEPTGTFRSSETGAVLVSMTTVAFIAATLLALWTNWNVTDLRTSGQGQAAAELLGERLPLLVLAPVTAVLALLAFGWWIRQIVANLPTLGVGYSKVSPTWAFFEPLVPGFNLYAIPARLGEMITRLGPHPAAMPLLGLAIIIAFGPAVVLGFVLRFTRVFGTGRDLQEATAIGLIVIFACQAVALLIGNVVVWQIEGMARKRHADLGAGAGTGAGAGAGAGAA